MADQSIFVPPGKTSSKSQDEYHILPLKTGLEYLKSAIEHLTEDDEGQTNERFAILHLYAGIEVLLKARLIREHWALVVTDLRAVSLAQFHSGDFQSVGAAEAVRRLRDICRLDVPPYKTSALKKAEEMRNRQQHFGLNESDTAIRAVSADAFSYLIDFIEKNLRPGAASAEARLIDDTLDEIREVLPELIDLVDARYNSVENELRKTTAPVVECPRCGKSSLVVGTGQNQCRVCTTIWDDETEVASAYAEEILGQSWYAVRNGGEPPIHECPDCLSSSLVSGARINRKDAAVYLCFSCANYWDSDDVMHCAYCGQLTARTGTDVCSTCESRILSD